MQSFKLQDLRLNSERFLKCTGRVIIKTTTLALYTLCTVLSCLTVWQKVQFVILVASLQLLGFFFIFFGCQPFRVKVNLENCGCYKMQWLNCLFEVACALLAGASLCHAMAQSSSASSGITTTMLDSFATHLLQFPTLFVRLGCLSSNGRSTKFKKLKLQVSRLLP